MREARGGDGDAQQRQWRAAVPEAHAQGTVHAGCLTSHQRTAPVFAGEAGQGEGGGQAVRVAHSGQHVEAAALVGGACVAILRPRAAPAWHIGE